jgi:hypothetical protein
LPKETIQGAEAAAAAAIAAETAGQATPTAAASAGRQREGTTITRREDSTCWICGRTSGEINSILSGDTEDEARIAKEIGGIRADRESLLAESSKWKEEVPAALKDFDLAFVLQNADQFKSMRFLSRLVEVGRSTIRELDEVSYAVRKGGTISVGGTAVDESQRAPIAARLNEFEKRTGRKLKREKDLHDVEYQRLGYIARLSGLKLSEGIDYLKEAGAFYYDIQLDTKERAKAVAAKRRPIWKLRSVKFKDFPREISVCNVCERLIEEIRAGQRTAAQPAGAAGAAAAAAAGPQGGRPVTPAQ